MNRRVVITGLGAVSGLGIGVEALWDGLVAGRSAIGPVRSFDASGFRSAAAAEVPGLKAREFVPKGYRKAVKVMARDIELAVAAAKLAAADAGLVTAEPTWGEDEPGATTYSGDRVGCQIGAGLIAAETDELSRALSTSREESGAFSLRRWGSADGGGGGMNNLPPLWMLKYLPNMLACHVTILHGASGPSNTITCAEASGLLCLGEASRVIERGDADACLSGGVESKVNPMGLLRLDLAARLAHTNGEAESWRLVRPYDAASPGTLLGEGGAILVLEERGAAAARGARVLAEVVGFGASQSPPPVIPPLPEPGAGAADEGVFAAIESALADAGVGPGDIDAIVPHGSGCPGMDLPEAGALRGVFADRLGQIPLVTIGPNLGECMAGASALQCAVAAKCLAEQRLPARLHGGRPVADLLAGACESVPAELRHVLVCTGSLGGQSAALVLRAV